MFGISLGGVTDDEIFVAVEQRKNLVVNGGQKRTVVVFFLFVIEKRFYDEFVKRRGRIYQNVLLRDFFKFLVRDDVAELAKFRAIVAVCTFYIEKQIIHFLPYIKFECFENRETAFSST